MLQCLWSCYILWLECPSHFLCFANFAQYLRFSLNYLLLETISKCRSLAICPPCAHITSCAYLFLSTHYIKIHLCLCPPPWPFPSVTVSSLGAATSLACCLAHSPHLIECPLTFIGYNHKMNLIRCLSALLNVFKSGVLHTVRAVGKDEWIALLPVGRS